MKLLFIKLIQISVLTRIPPQPSAEIFVDQTSTNDKSAPNALWAKDIKDLSKRDYRAREIYTSEENYLEQLDHVIEVRFCFIALTADLCAKC